MQDLSISLVTYHPHRPMLVGALRSLRGAVERACAAGVLGQARLVLVDNGNDSGLLELAQQTGWSEVQLISGQGNVGFGRGHNLAMAAGMGDGHLILNPDVDLQLESLANAIRFMDVHPDCGVLSPAIIDKNGNRSYLCKRYPTVFDLFLRGFVPMQIRAYFNERLARYEMAECSQQEVLWDPPIISGCFMLCRSGVLRTLGGFDPRYFLYFEDFDLSLQAAAQGRLAAVGSVRVIHYGGGAGRKGWRHVCMFCASAWQFFSKHGWRLI